MTHFQSRVVPIAVAIATATALAAGQTRVQVKDRTTPLLKALSPADTYHATLFDGLGQFQKPLDVLASVDAVDDLARMPAAPARATRPAVRRAAGDTATAFLGRVTEAKSYPTRDGLFLWTSYRVRITKALRQGASAKPPTGVVTVVRPGGSIVLEGMTVEARANAWPPLAVGTDYYLFTSFLDRTGAYKSSNRSATYQVDGTSVRLL